MNAAKAKKRSKFLSLLLRHRPELLDLKLEDGGWTDTQALIEKINNYKKGDILTFQELEYIVSTNDKQRFAFNTDKTKIRANQGHSTNVEMNYISTTPPPVLYHGTATKNIDSILKNGILKGNRQYVHLSADTETAEKVGARHGKPFIFKIETFKMQQAGVKFYQAENGVWLTDYVSSEFLKK
ncbi:RNA 2'-phosphotransferase [Bernardetia sp.]|uniref:RNA 2'-phosphotransferase n=1 Tax=Bernardetia sp. TaxID=1937974 RepID=UPI0025B9E93A|nr:RNA 2'-phosphotransferase [Bernardetia sp.]